MRKAFHSENGPLRDPSLPKGERDAMAHLFAGAIGLFKNAASHRQPAIWNAEHAAHQILIANELLQIATERAVDREGDRALADSVIKRDDDVDDMYRTGIAALQTEMQADPATVPAGTLLLFVISIIERVGDRAQNIAWHRKVIYAA